MTGTRIRELRRQQGLSLSELARIAGVAKGYLSQIEGAGETRPSAATLSKIAQALGTTVGSLLEGDESAMTRDDPQRQVPPELREFADEEGLPPAEVEMLAGIRYRGGTPKLKEDWRFIYESIRRSVTGR